MLLERVLNTLENYNYPIHDEKILQEEIAIAFKAEGIPFLKEVSLNELGVIDFMVEDIGIEIKIKGQKMSIYRQLERYAKSPLIKTIILANVKSMNLPSTISGKKTYFIQIRGGI
jgi:hypothetical protein